MFFHVSTLTYIYIYNVYSVYAVCSAIRSTSWNHPLHDTHPAKTSPPHIDPPPAFGLRPLVLHAAEPLGEQVEWRQLRGAEWKKSHGKDRVWPVDWSTGQLLQDVDLDGHDLQSSLQYILRLYIAIYIYYWLSHNVSHMFGDQTWATNFQCLYVYIWRYQIGLPWMWLGCDMFCEEDRFMTCWKVPRPRVLVAMGPTKDLNPPLDKGTGRDPFGRPYIIHVCTRSVFFQVFSRGWPKNM